MKNFIKNLLVARPCVCARVELSGFKWSGQAHLVVQIRNRADCGLASS